MPTAKFLSSKSLYSGNYLFIKRDNLTEFNYGLHYHDFYEVQLYPSDAGTLFINGQEYEIKSGDIVFIDLFEPHMLMVNPKTYQDRYCISINPSFLLSACSEESNLLNIFHHSNKKYPIVHLNKQDFDRYLTIIDRFKLANITHGKEIMQKSILYELFANLYNDFFDEDSANAASMQSVEIIIKLVRFIDSHISEDLSLQRLADEVNFSKYYICRVFRKHTGQTINNYIVSKRIELSKALLKEPLPIGDTIKSIGFNNYSYFFKTFKKTYGVSPADYKAAYSEPKT